jgi:LysM repeat protein
MARKQPSPTHHPAYATSVADAPTELFIPPPGRIRPGRQWKPLLLVSLLVGIAALLALLTGGTVLLYYSDWILPGISTMGVAVGGQTSEAAETVLEAQWQERTIALEAADSAWMVSPLELGITLDTAVTINRAHQYGRSPESLWQWLRAGGRAEIDPAWAIDLAVAEANLSELANEFSQPPQNAGIEWVNGRFQATPAVEGRRLDITSTMTWLEQSAAQAVMTNQLQLPTVPVAPAITDVSGLVEEANRLLVTTVTIQAYDPVRDESFSWVVAPEQWSRWLTPVVDPQAANQFTWTLDEQQAQAFLNGQTQTLGDSRFIDTAGLVTALTEAITTQETAVTMRVYHHPRQHIVQAGDTFASIGRAYGMPYPWIQHANPGVSDGLFIGQALTIPSPDELLPLPIVANKRLIVSISQQKMWAYENGSLLWEWLASTGIAESPTSPGVFQIQTHETNAYAGNWDLWMPYFMGIYQPVPTSDFMNGFHGFPTRDGQNLLWTSSLGHQVTYGCVLVSTENAQHLFNWAEPGVVVEIRP